MRLNLIFFLFLLSLPVSAHEWHFPHEHSPAEVPMATFYEALVGGIAPTQQEAFEKWESSCREWKQQLKELNPGTLVSASCGKYQHEMKKFYSNEQHHYQSNASFVVRSKTNPSPASQAKVGF